MNWIKEKRMLFVWAILLTILLSSMYMTGGTASLVASLGIIFTARMVEYNVSRLINKRKE